MNRIYDKSKIFSFFRLSIVLIINFMLFLSISYYSFAALPCHDGTQCPCFDELMQFLQSEERRNPEYKIIQARYDQDTLAPRHEQYRSSCYFFAIAPIIEYMGYSRFTPGDHGYYYGFNYAANNGLNYHTYDIGYYLSAEHLMAMSVSYDSIFNGCSYIGGWSCAPIFPDNFYTDATKRYINTSLNNCADLFRPGQEYGECSSISNDYEVWLDEIGSGCGFRCSCSPDASCGMYWFANRILRYYAGCNDMRSFEPNPGSYTEKLHMRRVVKAFVDNNLPLPVTVRQGDHFMVLIGYFDLDYTGLPRQAILTHSYGDYYLVSLVDNWNNYDNHSLRSLLPWNQHIDSGCEPGGWASEIDTHSDKFKLCTMPDGMMANCVEDRIYGAEITCEDDGSARSKYFAYDGDLFISDSDSISCDKVKLRYSDGDHVVESAKIQRFWYSPTEDRWHPGQIYYPDILSTQTPTSFRPGPINIVEWNEVWPDNYWVMAHGLSGTYTKRRATIEMHLNDGIVKKIELSPPQTYGITVECIDNDRVVSSYSYEADHGVFRVADGIYSDKHFLYEYNDRSCDEVVVRVNLGENSNVVSATLQRMYYTAANGEWRPANSQWYPDDHVIIRDGLSGDTYTRMYTWDDVWPDNYWIVGDNVGSGSNFGDRKTVLRLFDGSLHLLREIEIVPY